jgi:hypothetical protein
MLLLGGGVVAAVISLGLFGTNKSALKPSPQPSAQKQAEKYLGTANVPTAEQTRKANNMAKTEGKISTITATTITIIPTGQTKPVILKLSDTTFYSAGSQGRTADKASLRLGQMAIVAYDSSISTATSVWGGYNE